LTALRLALTSALRNVSDADLAAEGLRQCTTLCSALEQSLSDIVAQLRPVEFDATGFETAVRRLLSRWSLRTSIPADLQFNYPDSPLPPTLQTTAYRIVQEALTNVARHAKATRVAVVIQRSGESLVVCIEDNGAGFDVSAARPGHFGLVGMRERVSLCGGTLEIESEPGAGVTVIARMPLLLGSALS
jgi:signal transduction histidine kinase